MVCTAALNIQITDAVVLVEMHGMTAIAKYGCVADIMNTLHHLNEHWNSFSQTSCHAYACDSQTLFRPMRMDFSISRACCAAYLWP